MDLENSNKILLKEALNSSSLGILIIDKENIIRFANKSFLKKCNFESLQSLQGTLINDIFSENKLQELLEQKKENETLKLIYTDPNLQKITYEAFFDKIDNEFYQGYIGCFVDISNKEKISNELKQKSAEAEKLLKQKDDFIWQLGHDLKTPLTPLNSLLPILSQKEDDPKKKEILKIAIENTNMLVQRVDKILEHAKLKEFGTDLEFTSVNLHEVVNKSINNNNVALFEKSISVYNEIDKDIIFVKGHEPSLTKVFDNLISNAAKYSNEKSTVIIYAEKSGNLITVSFEDTGRGLSKQQIENIFDEFYKADESRHDLKSSGLGLSICKRIIEKHGGQIWASSLGEGKGTAFYFTLEFKSPN